MQPTPVSGQASIRKGFVAGEFMTRTYRMTGETELRGIPLLDQLNDVNAQFVTVEKLYISPLLDPAVLTGNYPVGEVRKQRRKARVDWQGRSVEVSLDEVDRLGSFLELELLADDDQLDAARECLASLAGQLALSGSERRSYLELVLANV